MALTERSNSLSSIKKESASDKRKLLWALLIAQGSSQLVYMNISTLVPDYVKEEHQGISDLAVGILFASYQLVFLVVAPILGDTLPKFGRRRAIYVGSILISLATATFACGAFCENDTAFYIVSFVARSLQGGADAFILVSVPSIIAVEWPEQNEVYQGYAGISMGVGLMMGPVIATAIVRVLSYFWTLMFFAVLVFVLTFTATCFIPKRIDLDKAEAKELTDVPYKYFFGSPRVVSVLVIVFIAAVNLIFMDPILVLWLEDLGVNEDNAGLGFALMAATFTIGSGISGELAQKIDKRLIIGTATFMTSIALWLAGGLRSISEAASWVGLGLNGLCVAGVIIPAIPEIIQGTEEKVAQEKRLASVSIDEIAR